MSLKPPGAEEKKAVGKLPPLPPPLALVDGISPDKRDNESPSPVARPSPTKAMPGHLSLEDAMRTTAASIQSGPTLLALPNMIPDDEAAIENTWPEGEAEATEVEPADYEGLADVADKAWKELLVKASNAKNENIDDLFVFNELLDGVEAATKKICIDHSSVCAEL